MICFWQERWKIRRKEVHTWWSFVIVTFLQAQWQHKVIFLTSIFCKNVQCLFWCQKLCKLSICDAGGPKMSERRKKGRVVSIMGAWCISYRAKTLLVLAATEDSSQTDLCHWNVSEVRSWSILSGIGSHRARNAECPRNLIWSLPACHQHALWFYSSLHKKSWH